jgi:hypothetical protein
MERLRRPDAGGAGRAGRDAPVERQRTRMMWRWSECVARMQRVEPGAMVGRGNSDSVFFLVTGGGDEWPFTWGGPHAQQLSVQADDLPVALSNIHRDSRSCSSLLP